MTTAPTNLHHGQLVLGVVVSHDGPDEGPSFDRSYTVAWSLPAGVVTLEGCAVRTFGGPVHRVAFPPGLEVIGGVFFSPGPENIRIKILDLERYAICEEDQP